MVVIQRVERRLVRRDTPARIEALGRFEFEGYASRFNATDGAGDIVAPGAFARSLNKRPPRRVRFGRDSSTGCRTTKCWLRASRKSALRLCWRWKAWR